MTKLAIYGDSWADCSHGHWQTPKLEQLGWPNLLRDRGWLVDNFAKTGSSLHHSYQRFVATHPAYDRIIFLVTNPGRWTRSIEVGDRLYCINSYDTGDWILKSDQYRKQLTPELRDLIKRVLDFYLYVQDMEFEKTAHDLMVAEILRIRPDAIVIPISKDCAPGTDMVEYQKLFVRSVWPDRLDLDKAQAHRTWEEIGCICHMSPEINKVVCESMRAALALGKWDPIIPDRVEHEHPADHYVRLF